MPNFNGTYQGTSPFLTNSSSYTVFRNVKDFGAKGDGITDDAAAINLAISSGGRVSGGKGAGGTTGQPALVYFPSGEYLVGSTVQMFVYTQITGGGYSLDMHRCGKGYILTDHRRYQPSHNQARK